jgi:hypothetical protein
VEAAAVSVPAAPQGALAFTGTTLPVSKGIAAGAGMVVAGSAAAFLARRKGAEPTEPATDEPTPDTI